MAVIEPCLQDSDTIQLSMSGDNLVADVILDTDDGNGIEARSSGLFVPGSPIVSAFPSSPNDGDRVRLDVNPVAYPGLRWKCVWDASLGLWLPDGEQPPIHVIVDTPEDRATATYDDLATVGPALTGGSPISGSLRLEWGARVVASGAGRAFMGLKFGASAATDAYACSAATSVSSGASRRKVKTGLSKGDIIRNQYKGDGGTCTFGERWLSAYLVSASG